MTQAQDARTPDAPDLVSRFWSYPVTRWMLLVPTALTALAGLKDIGEIARYLVSKWHPIIAFVGQAIAPLADRFDLGRQDAVLFLFFAPFTLYGIFGTATGREKPPGWLFSVVTCFLYFALVQVVMADDLTERRVYGLTGEAVLAAAGYSIAYLLLRRSRFEGLALPLGSLCALLALSWSVEGTVRPYLFMLTMISAPLFAPRRIAQTAVIVATLAAISLLYGYTSRATGI